MFINFSLSLCYRDAHYVVPLQFTVGLRLQIKAWIQE